MLGVDFFTEPFTTRREPLKDLINTFSDLYIYSDEESERIGDFASDVPDDSHFPPPPPPPEMDLETNNDPSTLVTSTNEYLTERFTSIEDKLTDLSQRVSENVSFEEFENRCKIIEERMSYRMQRECEKVKKQLELLVQELGQSVVDCLKRIDRQLEQRFKSLVPPASTPLAPDPNSTVTFLPSKQRNVTYSEQSSHLPTQSNQSTVQYNPPVKLDFPNFSSTQEDDPILFIERCEEYFAVRPLTDGEVLASLSAVLRGTAKDWWMAERPYRELKLRYSLTPWCIQITLTVERKNTDKYKSNIYIYIYIYIYIHTYVHKNATITNIQIRTCREKNKNKTLNKEIKIII